jgi:hypothetical protein
MTASMLHRHGLRTVVFSLLVLPACGESGLKGPESEVRKSDVKLDVPKVPAGFGDLPSNAPVKALRVNGKKLLQTEVTVKGYVTWAYDCLTAIQNPGEDKKDTQERIEKDPTLCERAKFFIGDTKETPAEKSIWVVDVPRPYNKIELKRIKKEDRNTLNYPLLCQPDEKDKKKSACPPYELGDEVEITGTWSLASPHSERNSEGLLVYKKMKNITKEWESPAPDPAPEGGTANQPATKASPTDLVQKRGNG